MSVCAPDLPVYRYSGTRDSVVNARVCAVYTARSMAVVTLDHIHGHWQSHGVFHCYTGSRTVSFTVIPVSIRYAIFIAAFVLLIYCESVSTPPF